MGVSISSTDRLTLKPPTILNHTQVKNDLCDRKDAL